MGGLFFPNLIYIFSIHCTSVQQYNLKIFHCNLKSQYIKSTFHLYNIMQNLVRKKRQLKPKLAQWKKNKEQSLKFKFNLIRECCSYVSRSKIFASLVQKKHENRDGISHSALCWTISIIQFYIKGWEKMQFFHLIVQYCFFGHSFL